MSQQSIDEKIASRAYQIWLQEGRPEGRSEEHWFQAKCEIEGGSLTDSMVVTHVSEEQNTDKLISSRTTKAAKAAKSNSAAKVATPKPAAKTASSGAASKSASKAKATKG